jgi:N-glycosylase/DNA lyase
VGTKEIMWKTPAAHGVTALRFLWEDHKDNVNIQFLPKKDWLDEFFFCLLGGFGITYELNISAFNLLKSKGYFSSDRFLGGPQKLEDEIAKELSKSQFTPLRSNGSFRQYRFPRNKAHTIVLAGKWLQENCDFQIEKLFGSNSFENREILLSCPGLGYKTASWFLRNIGKGENLIILDVHVHRILKEFQIIPDFYSPNKHYLEIENLYNSVCNIIGAKTDIMDLIIWTWERGGGSEVN